MSFQVTARTILQLGAELISSDEIAFYELIKNAIDAGSESVEVDIVVGLRYEDGLIFRERLLEEKRKGRRSSTSTLVLIKDEILGRLQADAPHINEIKKQLGGADSAQELLTVLEEANYIDIKDTGEGMSLKDLREVYLTIGTRSRLKQRQHDGNGNIGGDGSSPHPILGEKGVGRLSAMRLGSRLRVKTTRQGESRWNLLGIDWARFSHDSDELLQNIPIMPVPGPAKQSKSESGTLIHISGLTSKWDAMKVKKMVEEQFSRFADPFNPQSKYPIEIYFNNELYEIPDFDQSIFKHAHATVVADFTVDEDHQGIGSGLRLKGKVNYRLREIKRSFDIGGAELKSAAKVDSLHTLRSLGPFSMRAYWYNRKLLTATAGIPNFQYVKKTVNDWAGGLMLYRDGFRVYPYGGPDDDWLDLDQKALASGGYKVNRRQIIGKVDISSKDNPQLIDQTNREGLRSSDEKSALVFLLKHILEGEMRVFLNNVERKIHQEKQLNLSDLEKRVDAQVRLALRSVNELVKKIPYAEQEAKVVSNIHEAFKNIQQSMSAAREIAEAYKQGHDQTVHLAGVGLMVEMLAHELNRAALHALATLSSSKNEDLPKAVKSRFRALETQMKTLQKRLQILDPVSTTARQRKETFDLVSWIREILSAHEEQFARHGIKISIKILPDVSSTLRVKVVKGMIVQVLENLISNSVYWLKQQSDLDPAFSPKISLVIDTESREISFTDNGPGIDPERSEEIFLPFVTLKPSGEGKGLGLYIAREIATYHDAELYLSEVPTVHARKLNTFVFSLGKKNP